MKPTQPVKPNRDVTALLLSMSRTGFQGRKLGESLGVWTRMVTYNQDGVAVLSMIAIGLYAVRDPGTPDDETANRKG